jgi:putative peptidoglycan lipid II flippase
VLLGAAGGIAVVTLAARAVGFGRVAVLSRTLGPSCVGDTYQVANALPNVVFEVVAGGALAALVVPVLATAVAAGDRETTSRTTSALLTWTVALLLPVALLGALGAPLLMRALLGNDPTCAQAVEVGSRMLVVFMPQVVLYGVGIVLAGVLQAHRRFLGPALAPLLSSLVVIAAYLLYATLGRVEQVAALTRTQELVLSLGTTLGVAVLSLGLLVPLRGTGLRLRPTFGFPPGMAARARRLALGGVAALGAQQVALVVALRLAAGGSAGDVVVFTVATALFLLPWAVVAVPLATTVAPTLTALSDGADERGYAEVTARSLRSVLIGMCGAAAVLAVTAPPAARLLVQGAPGVDSSADLAAATVAFAPGLVGYGLLALLSRAFWARGDGRTPAVATGTGWLVVAGTDLALVAALPDVDRVVLLGIGNTVGVTAAGLLLVLRLLRTSGVAAMDGAGRSALAAVAGVLSAVPVGLLSGSAGPDPVAAVVTAVTAAAAFLLVARALDPAGVKGLLRA